MTKCYASNVGLHIHLLRQSLEGVKKTWFNAQSQELLHNIPILIYEFEKYFHSQAIFVPTLTDLVSIKMKANEDFVTFLDRWKESYQLSRLHLLENQVVQIVVKNFVAGVSILLAINECTTLAQLY